MFGRMAASPKRMNEPQAWLGLVLVIYALALHDGVFCEEDVAPTSQVINIVTDIIFTVEEIPGLEFRGDLDFPTAEPENKDDSQSVVFPTIDNTTLIFITDEADISVHSPKGYVKCVDQASVQNKGAVNLKLKTKSKCEDTRIKIQSVLEHLCGEDCKLEIFQEANSDEAILSGMHVDDDPEGMAEKFNNDNIKDKVAVVEAAPRRGSHSKTVLISLLLVGLVLAALLIAGYYLKVHRSQQTKGLRLAEESFQVDEENQGNTLVSVAPLPQEPLDKPTINGEPTEDGKAQSPPTNGHSTTQTTVADTEM
ncbi:hematopoietic progenitor cell antigen CD34 [Denticeps clupeoides]|uniref:Uncharacterized protein n=1 Tax=Denticeps clupeoides TaxID=299321 RepID=A0AAY4DMF8_9TELE|nr:hematopoietic progenitor cell antigen CD34-like [Denticeps clupeoides]